MKTQLKMNILALAAIGWLTMPAAPAFADEGHAHGTGHIEQEPAKAPEAEKAAAPQSVEDTLKTVHEHQAELAQTIADKKLDDVHHIAFAIRDLAVPLPEKATPDSKAKVEGSVKNIAKLAEALDASGDAGDQAAAEANLKKLDGVIKVLEAQLRPAAK